MSSTIPTLGAAIRHEFALEADFLTLNHGSYGATPRLVLAAQEAWRGRMEAQPTRFFTGEYPPAIRAAAAALAGFLGARPEDIAFVPNATTGCNAVLRSLRLGPEDEILVLGHVYNAVRNTVRFVTERAGARMVVAELPFPRPTAAAVLDSLRRAITPRTRVAVLDHITSASALALPIAEMIALCHAAGVPVLVDGAHAPGQVELDLRALGADWYTGNCHKWLMAPKGCAFLFARGDRQAVLHPVSISHGYGQGFGAEFDWTGTADPSAYLAVTAALDFWWSLGGSALAARNRELAVEAGALLAARLGTEPGARPEMAGSMALVRLPVPGDAELTRRLRAALLDAGTDTPVHPLGADLWLRLSAQAYNEIGDYERLASLLPGLLASVYCPAP